MYSINSKVLAVFVLLIQFWPANAHAATDSNQVLRVIYPKPTSLLDTRENYFYQLLELSLQLTERDFGPYSLVHSDEHYATGRYAYLIRESELLSIMTSPATVELETIMASVRIPLLKGIQGLRVLLVPETQLSSFASMQTLSALKEKTYGQGVSWVDTQILQQAGLKVTTTTTYNSLFELVALERIDAFPRGVNEVFKEVRQWQPQFPNLAVENVHALYYPLFVHFYVNKNNTELQKRVSTGLSRAIKDKQFDELFDTFFAKDIQAANLANRKMHVLDNPFVPKDLVQDYKKLLHSDIKRGLADSEIE